MGRRTNTPMRRLSLPVLALLALSACGCYASPSDDASAGGRPSLFGIRYGQTPPPIVDTFSYAAGTSGTFVVPVGVYVIGWWAHSTAGGTASFTPTGPREFPTCASWDAGPDPYDAAADTGPDLFDAAPPATCRATGSSITIPAGSSFGLSVPVLAGNVDELGAGTTFVFTSTDSYVVTMTSR